MHSKPTKKEIFQLVALCVNLLLILWPAFLKEDHVFLHSPILYVYYGILIPATILLVRRIMLDHPYLTHPWDEPDNEDDNEDEDDDDEKDED